MRSRTWRITYETTWMQEREWFMTSPAGHFKLGYHLPELIEQLREELNAH